MNHELRRRIAELVYTGKDGHIPSAFSIVDIIAFLYREVLNVSPETVDSIDRDFFILSKGHGCVSLYSVLEANGFISAKDLEGFCRLGGAFGEHPDYTKIPGVEASTGSLGHGLPLAVGIALGSRIKGRNNRTYVVVGDGECHEGTIWESANIAANRKLGNLCVFVDWNGSAAQLMPIDDLPAKWRAFGWHTQEIDGHSDTEIRAALEEVEFSPEGQPSVIVAHTVKGKGVPMIEGHGVWHHRIPTEQEYADIQGALA